MKILSKAEFFRLWKAGVLGNRTQLWSNPEEAFAAQCLEYGFREQGKAGGGAWERVYRDQFWETYNRWAVAGRTFTMDDVVPDEYQTIQGELCRTYRGMEGTIGASQLPMRKAMAAGILKPRGYCETLALLDAYMDPPSRDDVEAIFDLFPEATIEFTCFTRAVGVLKRETMFWEVRNF